MKVLIPDADFPCVVSSVHITHSAFPSHVGPVLGEDSSVGEQVNIAKAWPEQAPLYQCSFIWMTRSGELGFN